MVPAGKTFTIKWTADSPNPVSLLLLKGPSNNVVFDRVIVEAIPNSGSFTWEVPADLATEGPGGYGIQLIDDVDGHFQYSTQFGFTKSEKPIVVSSSSVEAPVLPTSTAEASSKGYEAAPVSSKPYEPVPSAPVPSAPVEESSSCITTTTVYVNPPVGTGVTSGVAKPTGYPSSFLSTGTGYPVKPTSPPEFTGSASGLKAGLGLAGAVAALCFML